MTPSATITAGGAYTMSFSLTSPPNGTQYALGFYDGTNWYPNATGSLGAISGSTVIFNGILPGAFSLSSGTTYALVLYSVPSDVLSVGTFNLSTSANASTGSGIQVGAGLLGFQFGSASTATPVTYVVTSDIPSGSGLPALSATAVTAVLAVTAQQTTTLAQATDAVTYDVPSSLVASSSYTAFNASYFDPTALAWSGSLGASSQAASSPISGDVRLVLNPTQSAAIQLSAGQTYYAAIYQP